MSEKSAFSTLLLNYFLNWQAEQGKRASLDDFADLLGYSRPTISMWLNGSRTPGPDAIDHLASIVGVEVYDALELPRPNQYLQKINKLFERLSPERQKKIAEDVEKFQNKNIEKNAQHASKDRKTSPR